MAINFPDSPSVNDTVTQGDLTWIWDGTVWKLTVATTIAPAGSNTQVQYNSSGAFAGSANFIFDGSAAVLKSTLTVGVDDTSHDVKFFGATSGKYMLWDESADSLIVKDTVDAVNYKVNGGQGSDGQVLTSTGSGVAWEDSAGGGASVTIADSAPGSPSAGNLWFESDTGKTFIYYGDGSSNQWVEVGASSAAAAGDTGQIQYASSGAFTSSANFTYDGSDAVLKSTLTVGVDDTGHDVKFFGATTGKYMLWDESADSLIVNGPIFAAAKMQTGQTSYTQEPWNNSTIALGNYGSVGTQGSYRTSLAWNYERGTDSNFHHLDINSYPQAVGIDLGHTGILFNADEDYENNHTTNPTTHMIMTPAGKVGIGTTTPMRELDVWSEVLMHHGDDAWLWQNAGSDELRLWFQDSYTSGDSGWSQKIQIDSSGSTDLQILGGFDTGYTQGSVMITAYGQQRGAGTYYFNAYSDRTWYSGMPYGNDDVFAVSRATGSSLSTAAASSATANMMFYIDSSGNAYNKTDSWGGISDERLKINVADARSYLTDLNRLRVVTYQLGNQMVFDEGTITYEPLDEPSEKMLGLVAQEVEQVFPSMVVEHTGVKTVKTSVLVPMLLKAVQELTTRIEELEAV